MSPSNTSNGSHTSVKRVVNFIHNVADGAPLDILVHGDFYALPSKTPHGPVVIARPLLNFTTMWKPIGAHITDQYILLLAHSRVLPYTQFALHASLCVANVLRVLHDYILFRCHQQQHICMVVDDVRHVLGSDVAWPKAAQRP